MTTVVEFGSRVIGLAETGDPAKKVWLSDVMPILSGQAGVDTLIIVDNSHLQPPRSSVTAGRFENKIFGEIIAAVALTQEHPQQTLLLGGIVGLLCKMDVPTPGGDEAEVNA